MHGYEYGNYGAPGLIGGIIMAAVGIAVLVGIIVLVVWLVRQVQVGHPATIAGATPATPVQSPLDILKTRYAKGEIDKEEYEERRKTLTE